MKNIYYAFSVFILFFYIFVWWGIGFGCGLGGSHSFDCRVVLPFISNAVVIIIISYIGIRVSEKRNLNLLKKISKTVFAVSLFVPLGLLILTNILPDYLIHKYWGKEQAIQSCDTGDYYYFTKGNYLDLDDSVCHNTFDICGQFAEDHSKQYCLSRYDYKSVVDYSQCSIFNEDDFRSWCEMKVAENNGDYDYCKTITNPKDSQECAKDVILTDADSERISNIVDINGISLRRRIDMCKSNLTGLNKDICLAEIKNSGHNEKGIDMCSGISTEWVKRNCLGF